MTKSHFFVTFTELRRGILSLGILSILGATLWQSAVFANDPVVVAASTGNAKVQTAIFAGGCFWCIESDFEKLAGVTKAVSGYTGGTAATASYKQVGHVEAEHYEAVEVYFDPNQVSYAELVEYFWRHIDPTDAAGQFCDKGSSYRSAIFTASEEQQQAVEKSLLKLQKNKPFADPIVTLIAAAKPFYKAEKYHQDYYKKNPLRYKYYRNSCGRDKRVAQLWGDEKTH